MAEFPSTLWRLYDPRTGISINAGFFQLRGAVDDGISLMAGERPMKGVLLKNWLAIEPWHQSTADEFRFWGEWWHMQEMALIQIPAAQFT